MSVIPSKIIPSLSSGSGGGGGGTIVGVGGGIPTNTITYPKLKIAANGKDFTLSWMDPNDTVVGAFTLAAWKQTIIVAKLGAIPESPDDGIEITRSTTRNQYAYTPFSGSLDSAANYIFRAFPMTWNEMCNLEQKNNVIQVPKQIIYGYSIDESISDEANAVTPLSGCANENYSNLKMNFNEDALNWGSWKDAFFMPRPCMLRYNGTVAYYLDPDDYTKKADGTPSDIFDIAFDGNAMMEWDPVFMSADKSGDVIEVRISNKKVNENYECWSCKRHDGSYAEHFYTPIYEGTLDASNRLRSMSTNSVPSASKTIAQFREYAKACNPDGVIIVDGGWDINTWADEDLIRALGVLITGRLNTEVAISNSVGSSTSGLTNRVGTANKKGMFYGHSTTNATNMKFFGMENWWGHRWRATVGAIISSGVWYLKMTKSTIDGSQCSDYIDFISSPNNYAEYTGKYINTGIARAGGNNSYITKMNGKLFSNSKPSMVFMPTACSGGSASTFYCDANWDGAFANSVSELYLGGSVYYGSACGLFTVLAINGASYTSWNCGASLSYRPF